MLQMTVDGRSGSWQIRLMAIVRFHFRCPMCTLKLLRVMFGLVFILYCNVTRCSECLKCVVTSQIHDDIINSIFSTIKINNDISN